MSPWRVLALAAAVAAGGCATLGGDFDAHLASPAVQVRECAEWYRALDAATGEAGVGDAQYHRLPGFPYLRVDRVTASLRERAAQSEPAMQAYAERLLELDLEARRHEIENLPRTRLEALPGMTGLTRGHVLRRTDACGRLLREIDLAKPQARAALLAQSSVPDDYETGWRVAGLYWLTRLPFFSGVKRWEEETLAAFARGPAAEGALRVRYAPPALPAVPRERIAEMLGRARADPLGRPFLSNEEFHLLAAAYAPSFDIEVAGDYDRFGALRWLRDADLPRVDAADPLVYVQPSYTRYGEHVLLQISYVLWFPERPAQGGFDLLSGRLDGLFWRVTLAPDGEPLLYDSMHPCGCYHMFFPTPRARPRESPSAIEEWAFAPQPLPRVAGDERPLVSIATGTHYIERVALVRGRDSLSRYAFHPYDALRSLLHPEGGRRSAFGPDGLIAGSERAERFLFWPMGIASPGAMRQWGRHATAFVGRRHFDEARLLERRFELDLGKP